MIWIFILLLVLAARAQDPAPAVGACWKRLEYRGQGIDPVVNALGIKTCPDRNFPQLSQGKCYAVCPTREYVGRGALCWQRCQPPLAVNGFYFCCNLLQTCLDVELDLAVRLPADMRKLLRDLAARPLNATQIVDDFQRVMADAKRLSFPRCDAPAPQFFLRQAETSTALF